MGEDDGGGAAAPGFLKVPDLAASSSSATSKRRSSTPRPISSSRVMQVLRVMPGRIEPVRLGGDDLSADFEHHVHGPHFFNVPPLHAVQPQNLVVPCLFSALTVARVAAA